MYGPSVRRLREELWEELGTMKGLGGYFNVVRFLRERNRDSRPSSAMRRFSEVIKELELWDLPLQGGSFTWRGGLNRFLVFGDWECYFNGAVQCLLPRPVFYHCPNLVGRWRREERTFPIQIREYVVEGRWF